jgi:hypothetical protein
MLSMFRRIEAALLRPTAGVVMALAALFPLASMAQEEAEAAPIRASNVDAHYTINWLGAHIGDFRFKSNISNHRYELRATADISVFFGAVTWKGTTTSTGTLTSTGPAPSSYSFRYSTGNRGEKVDMRFSQRRVRDVSINPPVHASMHRVPVTAENLRNVVDPLSAVILLAQTIPSHSGEQACSRRIPIFDGKLRYDLVLSYKGKQSIGNRGNLHGTAYVCRVKYVPVAGHKPSKDNEDYVTGNTGIEVWLVPMPEAGLMVPYYITVPTPAGSASMTATRFDVDNANGRS